ncbi:MAG: glucose-1-phosphate thymidylyltransferase [Halobacteriovoraceae bacterium]|nr:glucose-1-phosphate thymidylyltransferase [Halobacteriovoraceae bacterium]|tara:strand:- start:32116 stop:32985 length:870 start_codon:yes stop_codon:yes gene_type:complete
MKGIILAGGNGTRLHPSTLVVSKQLLPIYDKPMVYYPISTLMLAGIRDILIISKPEDRPLFERLLGSGEKFGIRLSYREQSQPRGIAEAFIIGEDFIGEDKVALILGDNIYYGQGFSNQLQDASTLKEGALIFGYYVLDPERYGVAEIDSSHNILSLEEKPEKPKSNYAITGLYFYDNHVIEYAKEIQPSPRGELEITDINRIYLEKKKLKFKEMGRGLAWLDTGTFDSMNDASNFVRTVEKRQGLNIACLEEIAFRKGFISRDDLKKTLESMPSNQYSNYLKLVLGNS